MFESVDANISCMDINLAVSAVSGYIDALAVLQTGTPPKPASFSTELTRVDEAANSASAVLHRGGPEQAPEPLAFAIDLTEVEEGVHSNDSEGEGECCGNALQTESYQVHEAMVRLLADGGPDVNAQ